MSKKHQLVPTGPLKDPITVNLGSAAGAANQLSGADEGKFVNLVGESLYNLTPVGGPIEGVILSVEQATGQGFTVGSVIKDKEQMFFAIADGLQATPGTGTLAIGDYVCVGTVSPKGTRNPLGYPRVCKLTTQPTSGWRVVGFYNGVGTVGAQVTIAWN